MSWEIGVNHTPIFILKNQFRNVYNKNSKRLDPCFQKTWHD